MNQILDILQRNDFDLQRKTSKEYASPCPFCGGEDRFILNTEKDLFWCRGCKKGGDAITFLMDFKGMTFLEACECLGTMPRRSYVPARKNFKPRETKEASDQWKDAARQFVEICKENLWREPDQLEWLKNQGVFQRAIKTSSLGWNVKDQHHDRQSWGLPPETNDKGRQKRVWLPMGLVIPYGFSRIRIRRPTGDPRYILIPGSDSKALILEGTRQAVVVVESELDGILIHDLAGDLVSCIALGSAQVKPDVEADRVLRQADVILNALDSDDPGIKAAWGDTWRQEYKSTRWPCLEKDPGEMFKAGFSIREWVLAGLRDAGITRESNDKSQTPTKAGDTIDRKGERPQAFDYERFQREFGFDLAERLAIMTADGNLTDEQALAALGKYDNKV